jgi:hypothetical protein
MASSRRRAAAQAGSGRAPVRQRFYRLIGQAPSQLDRYAAILNCARQVPDSGEHHRRPCREMPRLAVFANAAEDRASPRMAGIDHTAKALVVARITVGFVQK